MKHTVFILAVFLLTVGGKFRWELAHSRINDVPPDDLLPGHRAAQLETRTEDGIRLQDSLKVGDPAPTFVLRNIAGGEAVFLRDYVGTSLRKTSKNRIQQVVVLSFWATWCEPCKKEIPLLSQIAEEFAGKPVKFFLVNTLEQTKEPTYTEDSVRAVISVRGYTLPCLVDAIGRVADSYRVRSLPSLVVIDKDGIIRTINRGYVEGFESGLRTLLKELAEK